MKAIVYGSYGSPDVLRLGEIDKPAPRDNEVLVKVRETIVTPTDCFTRRGTPYLVRFFSGLFRPRIVPGVEFGGIVEAVGAGVTAFRPGDHVFGSSMRFGAHAEYVCVPADGIVATKPAALSFGAAAAACDGGLTALTFLRDVAKLRAGQRILVIGASGSVGSFAVQIARRMGAEVTGVASGANADLVRSLGAHHVVDYTREDFTENGTAYEVVFDTVGKSSFARCRGSLTHRGQYLATMPGVGLLFRMLWTSVFGGKRAKFAATRHTQAKLLDLKGMLEDGSVRSVIGAGYPLARIADAHRLVETGHKVGNVVVQVA